MIARALDPVIATDGKVIGLMITMQSFPGWRTLAAFTAHLRFVAGHHRRIERIAVVTGSGLVNVVAGIGGLFVHPKIRLFGLDRKEQALAWLETGR